jgi:carboxymethylenebutenolidase
MGTMSQLKAADGHALGAYRCEPAGRPRGGLVVVQEIFGVNSHVRAVADSYAADGYLVVAPAIFDRAKPNYETGYTQPDIEAGVAIMKGLKWDETLADITAAVDSAKAAGKVGILGYCFGGAAAWMAASRLSGLACAVPYYGGAVPSLIGEQPKCPVMFHWGETDHSIPLEAAKKVAAAHPQAISHYYGAGHGFNCDQRGSYHAESAKLARERTIEFLRQHVG